jgi:hypothetical protein
VEDGPPGSKGLVGGDHDGAAFEVAAVDDLEEHVSRVHGVGQVAEFVHDEDVGVGVEVQRLGEGAAGGGLGELGDEVVGVGEECLGAVLDGSVGDGDGEVGLAQARGAAEHQAASLLQELGAEEGAEKGEAHRGLEGEVEVLDGGEEGEVGLADGAFDAGLGAVGDLLGHEGGEEVAVAEAFLLGAGRELGVETADGGQVQAAQQGVEVEGRRVHAAPRSRRLST